MRRVKTISVCIPEELSEELRKQALAAGISVSSYTTMLLSRVLLYPANAVFKMEAIDDGKNN